MLFTFVKVIFYMRIFDEFSFLVVMLIQVFIDLRFFLMFFAMFITTFAVLLSIVIDKNPEGGTTYENTGLSTFFLMAFRSSIGDNEMESFL